MKFAFAVPAYLTCAECGYGMKGEKDRCEPSKFKVWCANLACKEHEIEYVADAPAYPLTPVEKN